jgi:TRAP-type C4-dicarboxylate transport system permease small subunit
LINFNFRCFGDIKTFSKHLIVIFLKAGEKMLLKRVSDVFEERISAFLFIFIFILMAMQVFTRYVLHFSFSWNIELIRYVFVWLTFFGAAFVRKENEHIKIEIFFNFINNKAPNWMQKIMWIFKKILTIAFLVCLIYLGYLLANNSIRFKSQAMQISQFYLYISVTVGGLFYLLREICESIKECKKLFSQIK